MNTKPFVILIMVIVLIGGGIGGAVALAVGSGDEGSPTQSIADTVSSGASPNQNGTVQPGGSSDPSDPAQPSQGSDEEQVDADALMGTVNRLRASLVRASPVEAAWPVLSKVSTEKPSPLLRLRAPSGLQLLKTPAFRSCP